MSFDSDSEPSGRLGSSMNYLAWKHFAGAVLDVFRENEAAFEQRGGTKPNADVWSIYSQLRQQLWERARRRWCERTGLGEEWWPYSADAVARLYFRFRKRNAAEIAGFASEIDGSLFGG